MESYRCPNSFLTDAQAQPVLGTLVCSIADVMISFLNYKLIVNWQLYINGSETRIQLYLPRPGNTNRLILLRMLPLDEEQIRLLENVQVITLRSDEEGFFEPNLRFRFSPEDLFSQSPDFYDIWRDMIAIKVIKKHIVQSLSKGEEVFSYNEESGNMIHQFASQGEELYS